MRQQTNTEEPKGVNRSLTRSTSGRSRKRTNRIRKRKGVNEAGSPLKGTRQNEQTDSETKKSVRHGLKSPSKDEYEPCEK